MGDGERILCVAVANFALRNGAAGFAFVHARSDRHAQTTNGFDDVPVVCAIIVIGIVITARRVHSQPQTGRVCCCM